MALFPLWGAWIGRQKPPAFDVAYAIMGHGKKGIRGHYAHATLTAMREALEKYEQRLWAQAA